MSLLRMAVIGGGHLGSIHARLLRQVGGAELVAIAEPQQARAEELAAEFDCAVATDVDQFIETCEIDAAVLAAPTTLHHGLGMRLLSRGIHTLIEKPLAPSTEACEQLVSAAKQSESILQVGHVERFNPAWIATYERIGEPRFIDAVREGTLSFRSMDAGVVLDLMIHDIDLILSLVKKPVISVQAMGFNWTGAAEDIAQARLTFSNGCVARLAASRVASEPKRQMRMYGRDWYCQTDFGNRSGSIVRGPDEKNFQARGYTPEQRNQLIDTVFESVLQREDLSVPEANPILEELRGFVTSITTKRPPIVSGQDGLAAVDIATQVIHRITNRTARVPSYRPTKRKAG